MTMQPQIPVLHLRFEIVPLRFQAKRFLQKSIDGV
jgi:hypothetical protein